MTDCLTLDQLFDHVRGSVDRLPAVAREHAAGCASCRDALDWIERVIHAAAQAPLEAPSEAALARVIDLAKETPATARE
ncbi:MAG: hypothetical protein KAI97_03725, partial [Gemmatimonadetes bacterium]|nr:hypothetical protein [Gemmatimonadota bacterium]